MKTTCSKCNSELGNRCGKYRYCINCHNEYMRMNGKKYSLLTDIQKTKNKARAYINTYIRRGLVMRKPCEKCGNIKAEGHHNDYNKPLEVIWLCRNHHLELHNK